VRANGDRAKSSLRIAKLRTGRVNGASPGRRPAARRCHDRHNDVAEVVELELPPFASLGQVCFFVVPDPFWEGLDVAEDFGDGVPVWADAWARPATPE
jgi:hypothetical protein